MSSNHDNPTNSTGERPSSDHTNRLAGENSPYLLQHASNPVDWYPWGEEAIERAKKENKPIFLSIGYSACHWCHVMERESFEDPKIAAILNEGFIAIKVDREERPDLDEIYMIAVQLMTGAGGWPLSVFLTPELQPFFGGTYFPPEDQYGRPGFANVLSRVAEVWEEKQDDILRSANEITAVIHKNFETVASPSDTLVATVLSRAVEDLTHEFDSKWGGFGPAPKFPSSGAVAVLLRQYLHTGDAQLLDMATLTLDRMAYGGMYDQIGGGFHRYSTDDRWLVPHFEKMLYDNALISNVFLEAWQVTHKKLYKRVAEETLDYVIRDMKDPRGGFHSSEDADSEGKEGKFYVWLPGEVKAELGDKDGTLFCDYYDVSSAGNFEGHNILNVPRVPEEFARDKSITPEELETLLAGLRTRLREVRAKRVCPGKDDKVLAAWNGMMISAFARGYQILGHERFLHAAEGAADFIMTNMVNDGLLLRSYRGGDESGEKGASKLPGYLDDYAEMANGLIDLYEATFDLKWLEAAEKLMTKMVTDFYDEEHGGFFYTSASHKNLLVRTKPYYDGAVPSGNATATFVLLRLSKLLDKGGYYQKAKEILTVMGKTMLERPRGYLNLLCATDFYLQPTREIAIAGAPESADTREFLRFIHDRYIPNKVLALVQPDAATSKKLEERVPLLAGKAMISGKAAVYVCEDFACKKPATDTEELGKLLDNSR